MWKRVAITMSVPASCSNRFSTDEIGSYQPYNHQLCQLAVGSKSLHITPHPALLDHCHLVVPNTSLWLFGVGWALLAVIIGFFVFWRAEVTYGRG